MQFGDGGGNCPTNSAISPDCFPIHKRRPSSCRFPPPECHLTEGRPLWAWCAVSYWLAQNNILKPEDGWNAEVVAGINNLLEAARQKKRNAPLIQELHMVLDPSL